MKIFTAGQIRKWDEASIREQHILSVDLMERAALACAKKITGLFPQKIPVHIFCGPGNNGGDGLAIARLLHRQGYPVHIYLLSISELSHDANINLQRLGECKLPVTFIRSNADFPAISDQAVIIDALFGTGLNRPLQGLAAETVEFLNKLNITRIAVDMPSGLLADESSGANPVILAQHTLSFQTYKRSFLFAENESKTGTVHLLDIGLSPSFHQQEPCLWHMQDLEDIRRLLKPRKLFSHKGHYGHAVLAAGSRGMMGAAVLAAGACLQSGAGKLTCYVPAAGYEIMQTARPEAMCRVSGKDNLAEIEPDSSFQALGIGPGLGRFPALKNIIRSVFEHPPAKLVMDADALNVMESDPSLQERIPAGTLLTPHPKEFDRMAGYSADDWERLDKAQNFASSHHCYIILKGHFSRTVCPDGRVYFNPTGNAGMAKGGSGDVLTGLLTGLLAQGYETSEAARIGNYIHGMAGDLAAEWKTEMAMTAGDLVEQIPHAWARLLPPS